MSNLNTKHEMSNSKNNILSSVSTFTVNNLDQFSTDSYEYPLFSNYTTKTQEPVKVGNVPTPSWVLDGDPSPNNFDIFDCPSYSDPKFSQPLQPVSQSEFEPLEDTEPKHYQELEPKSKNKSEPQNVKTYEDLDCTQSGSSVKKTTGSSYGNSKLYQQLQQPQLECLKNGQNNTHSSHFHSRTPRVPSETYLGNNEYSSKLEISVSNDNENSQRTNYSGQANYSKVIQQNFLSLAKSGNSLSLPTSPVCYGDLGASIRSKFQEKFQNIREVIPGTKQITACRPGPTRKPKKIYFPYDTLQKVHREGSDITDGISFTYNEKTGNFNLSSKFPGSGFSGGGDTKYFNPPVDKQYHIQGVSTLKRHPVANGRIVPDKHPTQRPYEFTHVPSSTISNEPLTWEFNHRLKNKTDANKQENTTTLVQGPTNQVLKNECKQKQRHIIKSSLKNKISKHRNYITEKPIIKKDTIVHHSSPSYETNTPTPCLAANANREVTPGKRKYVKSGKFVGRYKREYYIKHKFGLIAVGSSEAAETSLSIEGMDHSSTSDVSPQNTIGSEQKKRSFAEIGKLNSNTNSIDKKEKIPKKRGRPKKIPIVPNKTQSRNSDESVDVLEKVADASKKQVSDEVLRSKVRKRGRPRKTPSPNNLLSQEAQSSNLKAREDENISQRKYPRRKLKPKKFSSGSELDYTDDDSFVSYKPRKYRRRRSGSFRRNNLKSTPEKKETYKFVDPLKEGLISDEDDVFLGFDISPDDSKNVSSLVEEGANIQNNIESSSSVKVELNSNSLTKESIAELSKSEKNLPAKDRNKDHQDSSLAVDPEPEPMKGQLEGNVVDVCEYTKEEESVVKETHKQADNKTIEQEEWMSDEDDFLGFDTNPDDSKTVSISVEEEMNEVTDPENSSNIELELNINDSFTEESAGKLAGSKITSSVNDGIEETEDTESCTIASDDIKNISISVGEEITLVNDAENSSNIGVNTKSSFTEESIEKLTETTTSPEEDGNEDFDDTESCTKPMQEELEVNVVDDFEDSGGSVREADEPIRQPLEGEMDVVNVEDDCVVEDDASECADVHNNIGLKVEGETEVNVDNLDDSVSVGEDTSECADNAIRLRNEDMEVNLDDSVSVFEDASECENLHNDIGKPIDEESEVNVVDNLDDSGSVVEEALSECGDVQKTIGLPKDKELEVKVMDDLGDSGSAVMDESVCTDKDTIGQPIVGELEVKEVDDCEDYSGVVKNESECADHNTINQSVEGASEVTLEKDSSVVNEADKLIENMEGALELNLEEDSSVIVNEADKKAEDKTVEKVSYPYTCSKCSKSFSSPELLKKHFKRVHERFSCPRCGEHFTSYYLMRKHKEVCSNVTTPGREFANYNPDSSVRQKVDQTMSFSCDLCSSKFVSLRALKIHRAKSHKSPKKGTSESRKIEGNASPAVEQTNSIIDRRKSTEIFSCEHCTSAFSTNRALIIHKSKAHKRNAYRCGKCLKKFDQSKTLAAHKRICSSPEKPISFCCAYCNEAFESREVLHDHWSVHLRERVFKCDMCDYEFTSSSALKKHKLLHTCERIFRCEICQESFPLLDVLKEHIKAHTEAVAYECNVCSESFDSNDSLAVHQRVHLVGKRFDCNECSKTFRWKHALKAHKMTHHVGEQLYICEVCGEKFGNLDLFNKHHLYHSDQFDCPSCLETFSKYETLKTHMLGHSNSKQFQCKLCDKTFQHRASLKVHLKSHLRDKLWPCKFCYKVFKSQSHLRRHKRAVHCKAFYEKLLSTADNLPACDESAGGSRESESERQESLSLGYNSQSDESCEISPAHLTPYAVEAPLANVSGLEV